MELFYWDIETVGNYIDYQTMQDNDEKCSNLFKSKFDRYDWINKYESIDDAYINQSPIISTYGKIVCISFGYLDNNGNKKISSYYGDNEKEIVNSFNNLLKKIEKKNFKLCGYRILHFDLPWLLHKLHKYDIKPADIIYMYDKKPWDMRIVDMADDWKFKFAYPSTFDEMCYELGVDSPKDNMNGSEVHHVYCLVVLKR